MTDLEQILVVKMFLQHPRLKNLAYFKHFSRIHFLSNRQMVANAGYFDCHISIFAIPKNYFEKELPEDYVAHNFLNITHIFYGKYTIIETP